MSRRKGDTRDSSGCCPAWRRLVRRLVLLGLFALLILPVSGCSGAADSSGDTARATDLSTGGTVNNGEQNLISPAGDAASGSQATGAPSDGHSQPTPTSATVGKDNTASSGSSEPAHQSASSSGTAGTTAGSHTSSTSPIVSADGNPAQAARREIRGVVVDLDSGDPITGARVILGDRETTSRSDGSFVVVNTVGTGDYITANKEGYIGTKRRIDAGLEDGEITCRLELLSLDSDNAPPAAPGG